MAGGVGPLVLARFWSKVAVATPKRCWLWKAGAGSHGYGTFYPTRGRQVLAHRFALELTAGPPPPNAEALHSCDTKLCVNPAHLRWGSHAENMSEAADRGLAFAPNAKRSHCPQGHEMTGANVLMKTKTTNGKSYDSRTCRECNRIYLAKRRENRSVA